MKAFIFDMDGVIINSEPVWEKTEEVFLAKLMGEKIYKKVKPEILGSTINTTYNFAGRFGFSLSKKEFLNAYNKQAVSVYANSNLTKGIEAFIQFLSENGFALGVVTASPIFWVRQVFKKIQNKKKFSSVISLSERIDIRPKPFPDSFLEMIKTLKSTPNETFILEDSNKGVEAAKKSGAYTICIKENLPKFYKYNNMADMYVESIFDLKECLFT